MPFRQIGPFARVAVAGAALALGIGPLTSPAGAQDEAGVTCTEEAGFTIIARPRKDAPGADIIARKGDAPAPCVFEPREGDLVLDSPDQALYPIGIRENAILLDAGTGPDRTLEIYDLSTLTRVLTADYDENDAIERDGHTLGFWMRTDLAPTTVTCPEFKAITEKGLQATVFVRASFNLLDYTLDTSGPRRCVGTQ